MGAMSTVSPPRTGTLVIALTCRLCRTPYTPTAEDIRSGPEVYHRCPACRPAKSRGA
jgi:hypothetical protein